MSEVSDIFYKRVPGYGKRASGSSRTALYKGHVRRFVVLVKDNQMPTCLNFVCNTSYCSDCPANKSTLIFGEDLSILTWAIMANKACLSTLKRNESEKE